MPRFSPEEQTGVWKQRPKNELGFGLDKVEIAFGLKTNSRSDMIMGIFNFLGLLAGASLLKSRALRSWGVTLLFTMVTLAAQVVIFQVDRRFVVPILFPFATVCLGIALGRFQKRIMRTNRIALIPERPNGEVNQYPCRMSASQENFAYGNPEVFYSKFYQQMICGVVARKVWVQRQSQAHIIKWKKSPRTPFC